MIDNRVLAQLIWLSIVALSLFISSTIRSSIWGIVRAFVLILKRTIPWIILSWFIFVIYLASRIGLWDTNMMVATVWWSLASGTVLTYDAATSTSDMKFFTRRLKDLVSATLIVEALITLVEMPLPVELLLVPICFILMAIIAFSESRSTDTHNMGSCAGCIMLAIGAGIIIFNIWSWASGRVSIASSEVFREMVLPVYLTITFIPVLYLLTIYSRWELLYKRITDLTSTGSYIRRLRRRLTLIRVVIQVSGLHLKSSPFLRAPIMFKRIFVSDKPNEVRKNIQCELEKVRREEARQRELAERLERYAGVTGVDEQGRQLDRREFSKTCKMLEFLHMSYASRWNQDKHYVIGLKDSVIVRALDPFPSDSFHEALSDKADSWFIWRRTITGWVFAVGAVGPPPSYWYYDGPDPPSGPPREDSNWIADEQSLNWE